MNQSEWWWDSPHKWIDDHIPDIFDTTMYPSDMFPKTKSTGTESATKELRSMYIIGSLRNEMIPQVAEIINQCGYEAFSSWFAAGPEADDYWKKYEQQMGNTYKDALDGWAAKHVFEFDKYHLDRCDSALLVMPAGKSGCLELGYMIGCGKPGYVLMDNPDRWDVMFQFAKKVFFSEDEMLEYFQNDMG